MWHRQTEQHPTCGGYQLFVHWYRSLRQVSVAQRISWAAKRQPTKVEDIACCLLGIFDIQMPLIYGERGKAFRRLQEEIARVSDNQSILAWMLLTVPTLIQLVMRVDYSQIIQHHSKTPAISYDPVLLRLPDVDLLNSHMAYCPKRQRVPCEHTHLRTQLQYAQLLRSCSSRARKCSEILRNEPLFKSRD